MGAANTDRDERLDTLREIIHRWGIIPSTVLLSSHHYMLWTERVGPLSSEQESRYLHIAGLTWKLGPEIALHPKLSLPGRPTAFISRLRHPNMTQDEVLSALAPLKRLGSSGERGDRLEAPIPALLRHLLPDEFTIKAFPRRFHKTSRNVSVVGPDGRMFTIELRNRRTQVHDLLAPRDREVLETDHSDGRTTLFVTPKSTLRFRSRIAPQGARVVNTNLYLVRDEAHQELVSSRGWTPWAALPSATGARLVARLIAEEILAVYDTTADVLRGEPTITTGEDLRREVDADAEVIRILETHQPSRSRSGSTIRVDHALELHELGVTTQKQAAVIIGCHPSTLSRDFTKTGVPSPWTKGGSRPGSGRKSN